ncbi:MYND-type domain-containing protein [Mycena chlorophos]|uniref:MYND-type domain-containing protein n=1 Tax=Mycena chlorophos TaxID=658473 RepID=A0A8H6TGH0_MYCCL|nr:MYND-type domain-containing protein [Mycena chlorophos]
MHNVFIPRIGIPDDLPEDVKASALAACTPDCPLSDIQRVFAYAKKDPYSAILPVYFHLLDPDEIPLEGEFDVEDMGSRMNTVTIPSAARAIHEIAVCGLLSAPALAESLLELWPRLYPWALFLFQYVGLLPTPDVDWVFGAQAQLGLDLLEISTYMIDADTIFSQLSNEPALLCILAKGLSVAPKLLPTEQLPPVRAFAILMRHAGENIVAPARIAALCDGIDGGRDKLARGKSGREFGGLLLFASLTSFLITIDSVFSNPNVENRSFDVFGLTLLDVGLVPVVCDALFLISNELSRCSTPRSTTSGENSNRNTFVAAMISDALFILSVTLGLFPGNLMLPEMLQHRLLDSLVYLSTGPYAVAFSHEAGVPQMFGKILPTAILVRHACLLPFKEALKRLEITISTPAFKNSPLYPQWEKFKKLLDSSLDDFDYFESGERPVESMQVCADLECGEIRDKRKLKRCGGCGSFFYCSKACQAHDWNRGGHREACKSHHQMRLQMEKLDLTRRDRKYIRAIVDYHANTIARLVPAIASVALLHESQPPEFEDGDVLITLFDLTTGEPQASLLNPKSKEDYDDVLKRSAVPIVRAAFDDHVRRAVQSGGHHFVDVVRFYPGRFTVGDAQLLVLPAYTNRPLLPALKKPFETQEDETSEERGGFILAKICWLTSERQSDEELYEIHF